MSYLALYRKWRPADFSDVVGQDNIVKTLSNALDSGRVSHAYLFAGPRGIGKTTVARILAKGLNCQEGPTATPCGQCEECVGIAAGTSLNVIEIDGASNRGINDVRELRGQVQYTPVNARYKVYIIDEVHMLTTDAFNALLKTLEEPPAHVIFIFATTDPDKLPATILSRVQRFDFQRFSEEAVAARLQTVADGEGFKYSQEALTLIARHAGGSMRDALGLLEKCASFVPEITVEAVVEVLGIAPEEQVVGFVSSLLASKGAEALEVIGDVYSNGRDLAQFVRSAMEKLRRQVLETTSNGQEEKALNALEILADALREMRFATDPRLLLEVAALKIASGASQAANGVIAELEQKIVLLETEISNLKKQLKTAAQRIKDAPASDEAPAEQPRLQRSSTDKERTQFILNNWSEFLAGLRRERLMQCEAFLREGSPVGVVGDDVIVAFPRDRGFHKASIEQPNHREPAERVLAKLAGMALRLKCVFEDEHDLPKPEKGQEAAASAQVKEPDNRTKQQDFIDISLDTFGGRIFKRSQED